MANFDKPLRKSPRPKGTGGCSRRQDGLYQAVHTYRDENDAARRKYFYGRTQAQALGKMKDWIAAEGERVSGDRKVKELFDELLREKDGRFVRQGRQKENTLFDYRSQVRRYIEPRIGHIKLSRIKTGHLDGVLLAIMTEGDRPVSKKTALNVRRLMNMCFSEGKRLGWIASNPAADMMTIQPPRYRATILSLEQLKALASSVKGERIEPAILLAGFCGLRESEIAGLQNTDYDSKSRTLSISRQYQQKKGGGSLLAPPKTEAGIRTISVPPVVAECLNRIVSERKGASLILIPSKTDDTRPIHPTQIYHETMAAFDRAKMPRVRFHDLRHSANNILKQLGVDAATRRDILGHSTTAVTENIYTQTIDTEMIDAMDRLQKALDTEPEKTASTSHSV